MAMSSGLENHLVFASTPVANRIDVPILVGLRIHQRLVEEPLLMPRDRWVCGSCEIKSCSRRGLPHGQYAHEAMSLVDREGRLDASDRQ